MLHHAHPLVVDLDGTLVKTDLLFESASDFLIGNPLRLAKLPVWLAEGKSQLKAHLAEVVQMDAAVLPYNRGLLDWLQRERAQGRRLVLATASHRILAEQVAAHLGIFDEVLATDKGLNLKAQAKRDLLVSRFGERCFDYVGNDSADIAVWKSAAQAHVVSQSQPLIDKVRQFANLGRIFPDERPAFAQAALKSMRPHQWMKNILIFIPLLAAHQYAAMASVLQAALAFLAFGLAASSVYLLNDLVDVTNDRHHLRKRHRPFASGDLSLVAGWSMWPALVVMAFGLAAWVLPWKFALSLGAYVVTTMAYSLRLKQLAMVDVITLAGLYTLRIIAGAAAIDVPLSFWMLLFSVFLFFSLAFIKRYAELRAARNSNQSGKLRGRGYRDQDLELVSTMGCSAGYISVLVLALYIQDFHTAALYPEPKFIWGACPLLLYWISRAWLIAHRGRMHDDPIVFAMKDRASWFVMAMFFGAFVLAKVMP